MPNLLLKTDRQYTLVRYIASHQQVLFRSDKGDGGLSRAEILFTAVQYMSLSTVIYEAFNIYELTHEEMRHYLGRLYTDPPSNCRIFGLGGSRIGGVVVASAYSCVEDDREFWEPSSILKFDS